MEKIYTLEEVAKILGDKNVDTVRNMIHAGTLRACVHGSGTKRLRFRVRQSQLDEYLESREFRPRSLPEVEEPQLKISRHMKRLEKARA